MPKGTRVSNCVESVKAKGGSGNPYAICQSSTHENYMTGKVKKDHISHQAQPPGSPPGGRSDRDPSNHPVRYGKGESQSQKVAQGYLANPTAEHRGVLADSLEDEGHPRANIFRNPSHLATAYAEHIFGNLRKSFGEEHTRMAGDTRETHWDRAQMVAPESISGMEDRGGDSFGEDITAPRSFQQMTNKLIKPVQKASQFQGMSKFPTPHKELINHLAGVKPQKPAYQTPGSAIKGLSPTPPATIFPVTSSTPRPSKPQGQVRYSPRAYEEYARHLHSRLGSGPSNGPLSHELAALRQVAQAHSQPSHPFHSGWRDFWKNRRVKMSAQTSGLAEGYLRKPSPEARGVLADSMEDEGHRNTNVIRNPQHLATAYREHLFAKAKRDTASRGPGHEYQEDFRDWALSGAPGSAGTVEEQEGSGVSPQGNYKSLIRKLVGDKPGQPIRKSADEKTERDAPLRAEAPWPIDRPAQPDKFCRSCGQVKKSLSFSKPQGKWSGPNQLPSHRPMGNQVLPARSVSRSPGADSPTCGNQVAPLRKDARHRLRADPFERLVIRR